jgi:hypothetical protein
MTIETGEFIDLTPTPDGYVNIAARFGQSVLGDVVKRRKEDSEELLKGFVDIVFYLGELSGQAKAAKDVKAIEEAVARRDALKKYLF